MLNKLLNKGKEIDLFQIHALKDLEKSCAEDAIVEVIDYDAVKEKIFKGLNKDEYRFEMMKSCDALKIIPEVNRLDFIELKGINEFLSRMDEESQEEAKAKIFDQINKFNLPNKIFHSLSILTIIFQIQQIGLTKKEKEDFLNEVLSDYIIVIDSEIEKDEAQMIGAMMDYLAETSNFKKEFIIQLENVIEGISMLKIKKPLLKPQSLIDQHYQGYIKQ